MSSLQVTPSQFTIERFKFVDEEFPDIEGFDDRILFEVLRDKSLPKCRLSSFHKLDGVTHRLDRFSNTRPVAATMIKVQEFLFSGNDVTLLEDHPFISTQTPHEKDEDISLKEDLFWLTIMEKQSSAVVNLTGISDRCDSYTAKEVGESITRKGILDIEVTDTLLAEDSETEHYRSTQHVVKIRQDGTEKVRHFTYVKISDWEDCGATSIERLTALVNKVAEIRETAGNKPITVHCRAGVGRTGTFIVACAIKALTEAKTLHEENYKHYVAALVLAARDQRGPETVQRDAQLKLLLVYARSLLNSSTY